MRVYLDKIALRNDPEQELIEVARKILLSEAKRDAAEAAKALQAKAALVCAMSPLQKIEDKKRKADEAGLKKLQKETAKKEKADAAVASKAHSFNLFVAKGIALPTVV
jgi:hypothetical protein